MNEKKAKVNSSRDIRNEFKAYLKQWFFGFGAFIDKTYVSVDWRARVTGAQVEFFRLNARNELEPLFDNEIVASLTAASIQVLLHAEKAKKYGAENGFSEKEAREILHQIKSVLQHAESFGLIYEDRLIAETIKPITFKSDPSLTFCRLDFDFSVGSIDPFATIEDYANSCGQFMQTLQKNMVGDSFEHFLNALGYLIMTSTSPKRVVVWHGHGDDGKTTFIDWLGRRLGRTSSINTDISSIATDVGKAEFYGKRLVHFEEPTHGKLISANLKRIVGCPTLKARRLYQDYVQFPNNSMIWITTNESLEIDGKKASRSRVLLIESQSVADDEQMSQEQAAADLDANFENIVRAACSVFHASGRNLSKMTAEQLEPNITNFYLKVDGWIYKHFKYSKGGFMPKQTIAANIPAHLFQKDIFERIAHVCNPENALHAVPSLGADTHQVVYQKKRLGGRLDPYLWGFLNVSFRGDSIFRAMSETFLDGDQ